MVASLARRAYRRVLSLARLWLLRDPFEVTIRRWAAAAGDRTLRVDYPLHPTSVVFDVGGFRGDWTDEIARRYDPFVHVFEPLPEHLDRLVARFATNPKVVVHPFGLSDRDATLAISAAGDASSVHRGPRRRTAPFRDIVEVIQEWAIDRIDLIKINIEGGEYELLPRMVSSGLAERCGDIQVQFHRFVPDAVARRQAIRHELARTHELTYDYPFVWENWRRYARPAASRG